MRLRLDDNVVHVRDILKHETKRQIKPVTLCSPVALPSREHGAAAQGSESVTSGSTSKNSGC